MILVTGASGHLGAAVVGELLRRLPASQVAVSVREPADARSLAARGVDVRRGDFDDPGTLAGAFVGAHRLLLVSSSGIDHERRAARHRNAIRAAVHAGVPHVYYTSLLPGAGSAAFVMKAHLDTEAELARSGLAFTILKNGVYTEAWNQYTGDVTGGEVAIPADGPISWVSRGDLAFGTARLLEQGGHHGETLSLTGPVALDIQELATLLGRAHNRAIVRKLVPVDEYVTRLVATGKPAEFAREWATTYTDVARGEFGRVDPLLATLVERPLRSVAQVLSEQPGERGAGA